MVVSQISGGLGNQMFQYAVGRRLALERSVKLKLDISRYNDDNKRQYGLHSFRISEELASPNDIMQAKGGTGILGKLTRRLERLKPYYKRHWVIENQNRYDARILNAPAPTFLQGIGKVRSTSK